MKKVLSIVFATIFAIGMPLSAFAQSTTATKYTKEDAATVQQAFEKNYSNKVIVIPTWSISGVGKEAKVTIKVDLTSFDNENLVFYNYNKPDNKMTTIEKPAYSIDKESKLTFTTSSNQGFVVVSNGKLMLKTATTSSSVATPNATVKSPTTTTEISSSGKTVYWGNTGKKIHTNPNCRTIKNGAISGTESQAVAAGRTEGYCKVC